MNTQTTTTSGGPSGQGDDISLYDALMWSIEPELTTMVLPLLDALYCEETEAEKKERLDGYVEAFEEYKKKFGSMKKMYKDQARAIKKSLFSAAQQKVKTKDVETMQNLEDSIDAA